MLLKCSVCGGYHKSRSDKMPIVLKNKVEIFSGSGKKRGSLGIKDVPVGYVCLKCVAKQQLKRLEIDYKNNVISEKEFLVGKTLLTGNNPKHKKILIYNTI
jgi:hypothetical protein